MENKYVKKSNSSFGRWAVRVDNTLTRFFWRKGQAIQYAESIKEYLEEREQEVVMWDLRKRIDEKEAEAIARFQGFKDYGDKLNKVNAQIRREYKLGQARRIYGCPAVSESVIKSVFPWFKEFKYTPDSDRWRIADTIRILDKSRRAR